MNDYKLTEDQEKQLKDIQGLKHDWNNNGAKPFKDKHIKLVRAYMNLKKMDGKYQIFPTARGSVQIEAQLHDGCYIEHEVFCRKYMRSRIEKTVFDCNDEIICEHTLIVRHLNLEKVKHYVKKVIRWFMITN